jgi:hypothetical protein
MSDQNELTTKAAFLVTKLFTEHGAKVEASKRKKASLEFKLEGKPGGRKLVCEMSIPSHDEHGCPLTYEPRAEVELENPEQARLL